MTTARHPAVRLSFVALVLAIAAALSACGQLTAIAGPREWGLDTTSTDGTTHKVVVRDTSGRITSVEFDPPGVQNPGTITNPDGKLDMLLVPWTGGACDVNTVIEFAAAGQGLAGTIATETSGEVCTMIAIQRLLRLTLNTPTPAASVTLEPVQTP